MSSIVADTHALLWYINDTGDLSALADAAFEQAERAGSLIYIPTVVVVELRYLVEKRREIDESDYQTVVALLKDNFSALTPAPLSLQVAESLCQIPRAVVPDMPDRIIAATSLAFGLPLVTADHKIRQLTNITTIW
ncbi:MAG: PIN domain-containing protein [Acidobacteriota bacterium]